MSRIVDDDPPIKTGAATQAYRDNYDRIFGEPEEMTFKISQPERHPDCKVCEGTCGGFAGCPHIVNAAYTQTPPGRR